MRQLLTESVLISLPGGLADQALGCLVTCGHSNATWTEMKLAYENGVRHVDHFWCAMSSVASVRARCGTPIQGSMEQFVLSYPEMSTEGNGCESCDGYAGWAIPVWAAGDGQLV